MSLSMTDFNEAQFFKSAFTVDNVIFGFDEGDLKVLLVKRGIAPHKGKWALPGYFVYPNEDLDTSAKRILYELTGLKDVYLEQVHTFGAVDRHPMGRVITVSYFSLIKVEDYSVTPSSFALKTQWHSVARAADLAFDHNSILTAAFEKLKRRVRTQPIGFELLPPKFTLTALQHLYEAIFETALDKRNFRKKILSTELLIDLKESQEGVAHRPARLFQFNKERYEALLLEGYNFEI